MKKGNAKKQLPIKDAAGIYRWQSPFFLLGVAVLGAATIIGIVVLLTPLNGPDVEIDSEPRLGLEQTDPSSAGASPSETSVQAWWKIPVEPEAVQMESLKVEMLNQAKLLEEQYPKNAKALELCASVYYDLNQLEAADRLWKACLALNPPTAEYYLSYAEFLSANERPEEAIRVLEGAHSQKIETAGSYLQLAKAYEGTGDLSKAAELATEVTKRFPEFGESWFLAGRVLNQLGKHTDSEACLRRAMELKHSGLEVLPVLISVVARQGRRDQANELREQLNLLEKPVVIENAQQQAFQAKFESSLRDRAARLFFLSSTINRDAWNISAVCPLVQRSLELKPYDSSALVLLAEQYVAENRVGEAIEVYKRLIDIQPENIVHFTNLAGLAFRQRDLELAESTLATGTQKHPDNDILKIALAKTLISQRRPLEARSLMKSVLTKGQNAEAYMVLGASYQLTGDTNESKAAFERAQQLAPNQRIPK